MRYLFEIDAGSAKREVFCFAFSNDAAVKREAILTATDYLKDVDWVRHLGSCTIIVSDEAGRQIVRVECSVSEAER